MAPAVAARDAAQRRRRARRRAVVRSALVAAVRGSGARRAGRRGRWRPITTCASPSRASIRRARSSTTSRSIAFRRRSPARASIDAIRRFLASPNEPRGLHDVSRRLRRVLGDRRLRPRSARRCARRRRPPRASRPTVDDVRVSVAAEVARNYFELRGLQQQLAVAERSLDQSARDAAARRRCAAMRASARSRTWRAPAARVAAIEASIPPIRSAHRAARASPRRADRRAAGRARCRSVAAAVSAADEGAGDRRTRIRCCDAGRMSAPRNGGWPRQRRAKASPPPISIRGSRSPGSSVCSPDAATCSTSPTRARGR